jgi:hypothetical protein
LARSLGQAAIATRGEEGVAGAFCVALADVLLYEALCVAGAEGVYPVAHLCVGQHVASHAEAASCTYPEGGRGSRSASYGLLLASTTC